MTSPLLTHAAHVYGARDRRGLLGPVLRQETSLSPIALVPANLGRPLSALFLDTRGVAQNAPIASLAEGPGARDSLKHKAPPFQHGLSQHDSQPARHLLARAPIQRGWALDASVAEIPASNDAPERPYKIRRVDSSILGYLVEIWGRDGVRRSARLVAGSSRFRLKRPTDNAPTLFTNALELASADGSPVLRPQEIGAVVASADLGIIGVVVCGDANVAFAAPILDLADEFDLSVFTRREVATWNDLTRALAAPPAVQTAVVHAPRMQQRALAFLENLPAENEPDKLREDVLAALEGAADAFP